jgi:hypothetical protein
VFKITLENLIHSGLMSTMGVLYQWSPRLGQRQHTYSRREYRQGVEMSFAEFRADMKRARTRRRLYARINAMPDSTIRSELLAIAQRHEFGDR